MMSRFSHRRPTVHRKPCDPCLSLQHVDAIGWQVSQVPFRGPAACQIIVGSIWCVRNQNTALKKLLYKQFWKWPVPKFLKRNICVCGCAIAIDADHAMRLHRPEDAKSFRRDLHLRATERISHLAIAQIVHLNGRMNVVGLAHEFRLMMMKINPASIAELFGVEGYAFGICKGLHRCVSLAQVLF